VLFNTHYHGDHVGSNESLGKNKVRIIAHENVKKRLSERIESQAFGRTIEPLAPAGQPTETFGAGGKLTFGPEALEYTHIPSSHTDGDAFVFFPNANVIHTGDLLFIGRYPVVDFTVGGSLAGMAAALDRVDRVGNAQTRIIPGHGPVSTKADLRATRETWLAINQRLEAMAKQGRSVDEVVKAAPTKAFDAKVGAQAAQTAEGFLRQAYGGILSPRIPRMSSSCSALVANVSRAPQISSVGTLIPCISRFTSAVARPANAPFHTCTGTRMLSSTATSMISGGTAVAIVLS
jgi:glyoxylase-like metal-dependent hydrolase (beta-lactamase superfamily II)